MTELQDLIDIWGKNQQAAFNKYEANNKLCFSRPVFKTTKKYGRRLIKSTQGRARRTAIRLLIIQESSK